MEKEMKERMERMARRTWDQIAGDCLVNEDGEPDESVTLPRADVMEITCDADHMEMYGRDKEAYEAWDALPNYEAKLEAISGAFTYETYGW